MPPTSPQSLWLAPTAAPADFFAELPAEVSPLTGQLLYHRGVCTGAAVREFLSAPYTSLHDAFKLRHMDGVVARIRRARDQAKALRSMVILMLTA